MKSGWERHKLGELAELRGRIGWRGLTAKEYKPSGPLFLSVHSLNYGDYVDFRDAFHISSDRYDESPEIMLRPNDVLICKDGAGIGKVGIVGDLPGKATINSSLLLIRSSSRILPKFLYRCLSSPYFQEIVNSRLNGATTPHLYQRDIAEFPIVLPPLAEQQGIVGILDEAFAGIATAKANAEKNLRNARGVFESQLNEIWRSADIDWTRTELGQVAERVTVGHVGITTPHYRDSGVLFLRTQNVTANGLDLSDVKYVTPAFHESLGKSQVRSGDVLMSRVISKNVNCGIIPNGLGPANCANVVVVRPGSKLVPEFLIYYIRSMEGQQYLLSRKVGSAQLVVNTTVVKKWPIAVPSVSIQRELVDRLDCLSERTANLVSTYERKIATLDDLKESLLHHAFTGRLNTGQPVAVNLFGVPLPMTSMQLHAGVLAIAYQVHERHAKAALFGHVKAEKTAHLAEALAGLEFGRVPIKDAAGPNDFRRMCDVEELARNKKYFTFQKQQGGYRFIKGERFDELSRKAVDEIGDKLSKLDELLKFIVSMDKTAIELFATVFSGWNNLLLAGKKPTLEEIVRESRENWHPDKLKIDRKRFFETIEMMKKSGFVPTGTGKAVLSKEK